MKVYLAGYNLDSSLIEKIKENNSEIKDSLTPETISAAYARISRDPRPVNELREIATKEVEKARNSNNNIIFDMGHSSVAEHSVFNLDIIGLSRLAIEELENFRLASYTEKSQRYISLKDDYNIPEEIIDPLDIQKFKEIICMQNDYYHILNSKLKDYIFEIYKEEINDKNAKIYEGLAKEDARYITSLSTQGQLGMTVNARVLEQMIKRFLESEILEVQNLGKEIYNQIKPVVPSLIRYTEPNKLLNFNCIEDLFENEIIENIKEYTEKETLKLIDFNKDSDDLLLSTIYYRYFNKKNISFEKILNKLKEIKIERKIEFMKNIMKDLKFYDKPLREFEFVDFIFEAEVSAACYGQLKRHRMMTLTKKNYELDLGVEIPTNIDKIGEKENFLSIIDKTNKFYLYLKEKYGPKIAEYILTNSHKRKVLFKINARSLYHFIRLRADIHAQWDIRNFAKKILYITENCAPITMILACGKDSFDEKYKNIYKKLDK